MLHEVLYLIKGWIQVVAALDGRCLMLHWLELNQTPAGVRQNIFLVQMLCVCNFFSIDNPDHNLSLTIKKS